jgi:DNA-binding NtrC family response regulator
MAKILIVDDEVEILKIFQQFLAMSGFEVVLASGGREAVKIIKSQEAIDLMVLDLVMPGYPGVEVLSEMKDAGINLPYIILSGTMELHDFVDELKALGCPREDIYSKPIDLKELLEVIKKKLSLSS